MSGRLRATLYLDRDGERATGLAEGPADLRTGADLRLEVGVVAVGEDPEEKRAASALSPRTLVALAPDGRRKTLWRDRRRQEPRAGVGAGGSGSSCGCPRRGPGADPRPVSS